MINEVWVEHPDRPGSRRKATRAELNTLLVYSGWRESDDQSDPEPEPVPVTQDNKPASDPAPTGAADTPKKKGRS